MLPVDNDIREKILNTEGNIVVSASAGTGKTFTTVKRIIRDVEQVINYQTFAAITFTRKAAKEIQERLGIKKGDGFIGTNDNFVFMEIIQPFMYDVYGIEFKKEIKPDFSNQNAIRSFDDGIQKIKTSGFLCKYDNRYKNFAFQLALDILRKSVSARRYFKSKYFRLYIDEYQDSDVDMHNLFMFITDSLGVPLFVVGDAKQSIYGWRGAYSEGFKNLTKCDNFSSFQLLHNFRSNKLIQNYSNIFMDDVRNYFQTTDFNEEVSSYRYENIDDAISFIKNWVKNDSKCCFLNYRRDSAEEWSNLLKNNDLDFVYIPPSPLDYSDLESEHVWIARLIANYLIKDRFNEYDVFSEIPFPESFEFRKIKSILKQIEEKRSEETIFHKFCIELYKYLGYPMESEKISNEINVLFNVVNSECYIPSYNSSKYQLTTSTIHSSKGLEYEQVIIMGNDYNFNSEDDRFLHYVAVSRPKARLLILIHNDARGLGYMSEIVSVVKKTVELGFDIKVSDVIKTLKQKKL
ncbi:ATP-dependent helicase [Peribacillus simplex]|uniref:UvrD-helicase domain-containing protein n=1 Tax=Peribacillus simplex TaxID=1478 RepID=UPI0010BE9306|nr:UvrD-helicase domain-containing protein [Peribacillus simplex]TKG98623.1 ATP-dependent helicase [Peribacillus simplex]